MSQLSPNQITAFAPGKVIISGEHSVVYGHPAVTMALPSGIRVKLGSEQAQISSSESPKNSDSPLDQLFLLSLASKNPVIAATTQVFATSFPIIFAQLEIDQVFFSIHSQLQLNSGLGSSSALATALIKALAKRCQLEITNSKLATLVWGVEQKLYPTASPVDAVTVAMGGSWIFEKKDSWEWKSLPVLPELNNFTLVDSGSALETTAEMVAKVKSFIDSNPKAGQQIMAELGQVTRRIAVSISSDSFDPSLLTLNQRLLEKLPIINRKAKQMISDIEDSGGYAKITGAGGIKTGSGMILVWRKN